MLKMFFNKKITNYLFSTITVLSIVLFAVVVYAAIDSYRVNKTTSSIINESGSCRVVTNTSNVYDYFIPTKTLTEWNLFKQNKPADVSLSNCYQCPTSGQIYSDASSCGSACTQTANCSQSCASLSCSPITDSGLGYPINPGYGANGDVVTVWGRYHGWDNNNSVGIYTCSNGTWTLKRFNNTYSTYGCGAIQECYSSISSEGMPIYICDKWYSPVYNSLGSFDSIAGGYKKGCYPIADVGYANGGYSSNICIDNCPLGGYPCSGSPSTCTAGQSCNLYNN